MNGFDMVRSMVPLKTERRLALLSHSQREGKNTSKLNSQVVILPPSKHYSLLARLPPPPLPRHTHTHSLRDPARSLVGDGEESLISKDHLEGHR